MSPDVGIKHIPISTKLPKKKSKYILLYLNVPFFKIAQKVTKYLAIFEIKFDVYTFQKYPNLVTLLYHLSFVFRLRMIKMCDKCLSSITTGIRRRRRRRRRWCHVNVKLFTITHRCVIYGKLLCDARPALNTLTNWQDCRFAKATEYFNFCQIPTSTRSQSHKQFFQVV